jgi:threonine dehydratase
LRRHDRSIPWAASTANPRAAARKDKARRPGKVGLILSGGSVDTDVYAQVLSA